MKVKQKNSFNKVTKVSLVIYFSLILACFVATIIPSVLLNDWRILYGYLVCLCPSLIFALISILLPIEKFFATKTKKMIFLYCLLYVLKYIFIFLVPILCILYGEEAYFNRWSMLGCTLIAPLLIIGLKIALAITANKSAKKEQKPTTNSIKF